MTVYSSHERTVKKVYSLPDRLSLTQVKTKKSAAPVEVPHSFGKLSDLCEPLLQHSNSTLRACACKAEAKAKEEKAVGAEGAVHGMLLVKTNV